jgi:hypothetical protein
MAKIHTRSKRSLRTGSTSRQHKFWFTTVEKKKGAKSFRSEERAKEWASEQKLDTKKFYLHVLQNGKKFQWRSL